MTIRHHRINVMACVDVFQLGSILRFPALSRFALLVLLKSQQQLALTPSAGCGV